MPGKAESRSFDAHLHTIAEIAEFDLGLAANYLVLSAFRQEMYKRGEHVPANPAYEVMPYIHCGALVIRVNQHWLEDLDGVYLDLVLMDGGNEDEEPYPVLVPADELVNGGYNGSYGITGLTFKDFEQLRTVAAVCTSVNN